MDATQEAPATSALPPGIPPLIPADILGGHAIPMRISRGAPRAAAAPVMGQDIAGQFSPTVTGASPLPPEIASAIAETRKTLSLAVAAMTHAEAKLAPLIASLAPAETEAQALAHFDLSEVRRFSHHLTAALDELRL